MSETGISYSGGGRFATARRGGLDDYEVQFIRDSALRGRTKQQVSRMVGRSFQDVANAWPPEDEIKKHKLAQAIAERRALQALRDADESALSKLWRQEMAKVAPPLSVQIIAQTAKDHGLTPEDITGGSRIKHIILARQDAMWRLCRSGRWSLPTIGGMLGGRDHSTVISGRDRHQARLDALRMEEAA